MDLRVKEERSMKLHTAKEDYLKAILVLRRQKGTVRSIDIARYFNYSKPSVSYMVKELHAGGFVNIDSDGYLDLTDSGLLIAQDIYDKHCFFTKVLVNVGIDIVVAEQEACKMEHTICQESFQYLKMALVKLEIEREKI